MVSVITITYNRKAFLEIAIRSVLTQSYQDFEYIIVDDGSNDGTEQMVKAIGDKRIKYLFREHTGITSAHKNEALENCSGEIVAFLDSDDYWHKDYLKEITQIYDTRKVNSVITNAIVFDQQIQGPILNEKKLGLLSGNLLTQKLNNDHFIICSCCFSFRRNLNVKFNSKLASGDNDFYMRVLATGSSIVHLKELAYIRKHEGNSTRPQSADSPFIAAYEEELVTLDTLRKQRAISDLLYRKTYSRFLYRQAQKYSKIGMKEKARAGFLKAFLLYPFKWKALVKYFMSF